MKQPKTIQELYEIVGENPFVWCNDNYSEELTLINLIEETFQVTYLSGAGGSYLVTEYDLRGEFKLMDWFEKEKKTLNSSCSCDFYKVLLVSGCQCGGK